MAVDRSIYDPSELESWAAGLSAPRYSDAMRDGEAFEIATDTAGNVIAFCSFERDRVKGLYVDPAWANRGVGSLLLQRAEASIRLAGQDAIQVCASLSGQPFYERHGYVVIRTEPMKTRGGLSIETVQMSKNV